MSEKLWGELRSALHDTREAVQTRWTNVISTLEHFTPEERDEATHYALMHMHHEPDRWPTAICHACIAPGDTQHTFTPWSAPLIKSLDLHGIGDEKVPDVLALLQTPGLQLSRLRTTWSSLSAPALATLMQAPALTGITELYLDSTHGATIKALTGFNQLARLTALDLSELEDRHSETMTHVLDRCLALTHLGIHGDMYETRSWLNVTRGLRTTLRTLDVSGSFCPGPGIKTLRDAHVLDGLVAFNAGRSSMGTAGLKTLALAPNDVLNTLDLSQNDLGAAGIEAMVKSDFAGSLRELVLDGNSLRTIGRSVKALQHSGVLERLTHLDMSYTNLGPRSSKSLFAQGLPHMRQLSLKRSKLDAKTMRALVNCEMPALEWLDVSRCELDEDALTTLTQANWPALRHLAIDQSAPLSSHLVEALRDALGEAVHSEVILT